MKYQISDAAVKRLIDMLDVSDNDDTLPTIKQWAINEHFGYKFHSVLADLVVRIRDDHPYVVFQIAYNLAVEMGYAETKLLTIKRGFDAIDTIDIV